MSSKFTTKRNKRKLPVWKIRLVLNANQNNKPFEKEVDRLVNNLTSCDLLIKPWKIH